MKMIKMSEKKSMKGMKWIIVLLAVFLVAGVFVGVVGAWTITIPTSEHGSVSSSPSGSAEADETVTLTVTPEQGYELNTLTVTKTSGNVELNEKTFTMPDEDVTVTATFKEKEYTITVTKEGEGTVSASKNKAKFRDEITLTVSPGTGYKFKEWRATPSSLSVGENNTFTMPAENVTVKAVFEEDAQKFTVTYNGNGQTSGSVPTDQTQYDSGATVTVLDNTGTLEKTGYTFAGWNTNAAGTGTNYAVGETFNISANTTLYAKWTAQTQTITSITINGITAPALGETAAAPANLSVSATTPEGHNTDLTISGFKWKKGTEDVPSTSTFSVGTYTAEFTITPGSGVTIQNNATVIAGSSRGTYSSSSGKATISYTLGEISSIGVSLTTPAGGSAAPAITLTDTANLRMGNDLKWYKGTSDTALASNATLEYNTEYRAVFTVLIADDDTHKFASTVSVSGPDCVLSTSSVVKDSVTPDSRVTVTLKFKTAVDKEIDTVSLTMNAPSAGSTVSNSTSLVTAESNAKYSVNSLRWYSGTKELTTSDKFEYGTKYTAKIVLKTTDDYVFNSGIKKSDVKVNSNTVDKDPSLTDSSKTLTLEYTFTEAAKPTVTLTANPSSPKIGVGQTSVAVQFSYTITGNYGSATINFGDGSAASTLSSKSGTASHTYTGTGPYTVTITVKDASGVLLSNGKLNITVGKDTLTAGFTATPASDNPQKISFTGTTSGTVSKWEWDLGDGTKMNEKSFTHTYKKAGDYTVTLTVYSGELSDTTSKTLTVVKGTGDDEPFLIIGDTEVPSPLDIIAEFIHLLQSLFNFEEHPLFPDLGGE